MSIDVQPDLTERAEPLGWLASTPSTYPVRFAVAGITREEATERFAEALTRWEAATDADGDSA